MDKKNNEFAEIELLKDRYRERIIRQERKLRTSFGELSDNLTGVTLYNKVKENLFSGSGFAFKLGFMAVTLLRRKLDEKRKK